MKLYCPVLIESAEQAEALPRGSFQHPDCVFGARPNIYLVPIEAEEGTDTIQTGAEHFYTRTRYITPWEEAQ